VFGCFKVSFRKIGKDRSSGRSKSTQMNLLVMENLLYDRRFSRVSFVLIILILCLGFMLGRFTISRAPPEIAMFDPLDERMKSFLTKISSKVIIPIVIFVPRIYFSYSLKLLMTTLISFVNIQNAYYVAHCTTTANS
jgi:hypothetical protein